MYNIKIGEKMDIVKLEKAVELVKKVEEISPNKTNILLHLYKVKKDSGANIALAIGYRSRGYTRPLKDLRNRGLIKKVKRGFYEITLKGEEYINSILFPEFTEYPKEYRIKQIKKNYGEKMPEDLKFFVNLYKKEITSEEKAIKIESVNTAIFDVSIKKTKDGRIYLTDLGIKIAKGALSIWY